MRWFHTLSQQCLVRFWIDARIATLVYAAGLGGLDTIRRSLATHVGLELGKRPQHVEERLSCRAADGDRLLRCLQSSPLTFNS